MSAIQVGDLVRVTKRSNGFLKRQVGSLMTVRALGGPDEFFHGQARVDNGDPKNPDLHTNGMTVSAWCPVDTIEKVGE